MKVHGLTSQEAHILGPSDFVFGVPAKVKRRFGVRSPNTSGVPEDIVCQQPYLRKA
jgi:hypothetical protein